MLFRSRLFESGDRDVGEVYDRHFLLRFYSQMTRVRRRSHAEACAVFGADFTGKQMYLQILSGC